MSMEEIAYKKAKAKYDKECENYGMLRGVRLNRLADELDAARKAYKEQLKADEKETPPMKTIEELDQEEVTLCQIEWIENWKWKLTRTDTKVSCTFGEDDFESLYICKKLIRFLKRRKTWFGYMPESSFDAPCWKQSH